MAFFPLIMVLVAVLIWSNHTILFLIDNRTVGLAVRGTTVLLCASLITAIGIAATASLKTLIID